MQKITTLSPLLDALRSRYEELRAQGLRLDMTRGQPSDQQLDLSMPLLQAVGPGDTITSDGVDIRNYPGSVTGLREARELCAELLGTNADEVIVGNNASLMLMSHVLVWGLLHGMRDGGSGWVHERPRMIVTVPGYDRHFELLHGLGFETVSVPITCNGPDTDAIEALVRDDSSIKGILFVPVYSNPTGDCISDAAVERLVRVQALAPDFTIFADNAYAAHHLGEPIVPRNLLRAADEAGHPERVVLFGSLSKVTFAGAGISCLAASAANVKRFSRLLSVQTIGPNKIEQYRHARFLGGYPGGLAGLMRAHADIVRPKFEAVQEILSAELGDAELASWTRPRGGYFVTLRTARPVASRVIELAGDAGVALTPAGATYPQGMDPHNQVIRLAPTRPPLSDVRQAMEVVALCVRLASEETREGPGFAR